jgi:hypothetical protein
MSALAPPNDVSNGDSENIRIVARIKPIPDDPNGAVTAGSTKTLTIGDDGKSLHFMAATSSAALSSPMARSPARYKAFTFDSVAPPDTSQSSFFTDSGVQSLADGVCKGINGTVICFGQQGMGKTYTVFGADSPSPSLSSTPAAVTPTASTASTSGSLNRYASKANTPPPLDPNAGLLPRAVRRIFEAVKAEREATPGQLLSVEAKVSFYQIHNEKVRLMWVCVCVSEVI